MRINKIKIWPLFLWFVFAVLVFNFSFSSYFFSKSLAAQCDIKEAIFTPSGDQKDTWFHRGGESPTFKVKIVGNGSCGGKTVLMSLANVRGINHPMDALAFKDVSFDQNSNEIEFTFRAGEEACAKIVYGSPFGYDCQMQFYFNIDSVGEFWSDGISGKEGELNYECDQRFNSCGSQKFELLGIRGGIIGKSPETICAYVAENGVYACIPSSGEKAVENKCQELTQCKDKDCKSVARNLCATRAYNYGCIIYDTQRKANIYTCSPDNKSDCSDTSGNCTAANCQKIEPAKLCGEVAGPGTNTGNTGGAPVTTQYVFNLTNPIGVTNFQDLINIIGKWIFNLAIPIAVIIIIYAGVLMLTSGGVPARFQKGAKALWYAVIGLAIVLIGKGFVTLIQSILSLKNK